MVDDDEDDESVQRIVVNRRHGVFNLSEQARQWLGERGFDLANDEIDIPRDNALLVECVEVLGDEASGVHSALAIVEVPAGVDWRIESDDGREWVAEEHRTWRP